MRLDVLGKIQDVFLRAGGVRGLSQFKALRGLSAVVVDLQPERAEPDRAENTVDSP